jgi:excisionase family DNA binding protein
MDVGETSERLEVSKATVYALVASGKLRCSRIGVGRGVIRISEEQLAEYLRGAETKAVDRSTAPAPPPFKLKHLRLP